MKTKIRIATVEDAEALLEIYEYYVLHTAITFEYEVPSVEEFQERIRRTLEKYPYFVAERDGRIAGYAYASSFHTRPAYGWAAETTVYVRRDCKGTGVGRVLYDMLQKALALQNIKNLYACIAYPQAEDEYLTRDSVNFHKKMGFVQNGEFTRCGYKFDRWYNMVWMEKHIGEHETVPASVKKFKEILPQLVGIEM